MFRTHAALQVEILALERNLGFSAANNIALRQALARGTEHAILLNNDTFVAPNFVEEMLGAADGDPSVGAACPKIYFATKPNVLWYAGADFSLWRGTPRRRGWKETDQGQFDHRKQITAATGCAMLVRCNALGDVGLLDERFWAYLEDVEWSVRFLKKGYRLALAPQARVWHGDGATWVRALGCGSQAKRQYLSARNMLLLARKHAAWWQLPTCLLGFLVNYVAFYTALRLWQRDLPAAWALYRGVGAGFRAASSMPRWNRKEVPT